MFTFCTKTITSKPASLIGAANPVVYATTLYTAVDKNVPNAAYTSH